MTLADRVYADLVARIDSGEFPPGSRLPRLRQLVDEYTAKFGGVSLGPVREATSRLKWAGRIRTVQGGGMFVAGDDNEPTKE